LGVVELPSGTGVPPVDGVVTVSGAVLPPGFDGDVDVVVGVVDVELAGGVVVVVSGAVVSGAVSAGVVAAGVLVSALLSAPPHPATPSRAAVARVGRRIDRGEGVRRGMPLSQARESA
jgi:hypothetical protein